LLVTKPRPAVRRLGLAAVRKIGALAIADEEEITQHLHVVALAAFAEEIREGHAQMLAEEIEHGGFDRRERMDGRSQIERLQAASSRVAFAEAAADFGHHRIAAADGLPDHERSAILERLADLLAARN